MKTGAGKGRIGFTLCLMVLIAVSCTQRSLNSQPSSPPSETEDRPVVAGQMTTGEMLPPPFSLAILPFEDYSRQSDLSWLKNGLPDMLITDLSQVPHMQIVSRYRLGEVLREQWLQQRGAFDDRPAVRIGRLTGAKYLLGGLFYVDAKHLVVEVHLLDVEKGAVVRALRVSGPVHSISEVEQVLSHRVTALFVAQEGMSSSKDRSTSLSPPPSQAGVEFSPSVVPRFDEQETKIAPDSATGFPSSVQMDTLLGFEKVNFLHRQSVRLAEQIWQQAIHIHLDQPVEEVDADQFMKSGTRMSVFVPVSVRIEPERLKGLSPALHISPSGPSSSPKAVVVEYRSGNASSQKIFLEQMKMPRRLFVRALDQSGTVIAISSNGSWRMDQFVKFQENGTMLCPDSSSPILADQAVFPGHVFANPMSVERFDAIIVPVPAEGRHVTVERVEDEEEPGRKIPLRTNTLSETETSPQSGSSLDPHRVSQPFDQEALQTWLLQHWNPPIVESLPSSGYLPGNKRSARVLVKWINGRVTDFHILHLPPEPPFADSIHEVFQALKDQCLSPCPDSSLQPNGPVIPAQLRIQFDLVKDIQFAGLNR